MDLWNGIRADLLPGEEEQFYRCDLILLPVPRATKRMAENIVVVGAFRLSVC